MSVMDKLIRFKAYAMTNSNIGVYNEDAMTSNRLQIVTADKVKECLEQVNVLTEAITNIQETLSIKYTEETEELEVTIGSRVAEIKEQVNASYVCIYNEDAMTQLELAGQTAKAVNECLKAINMLTDLVLDINNFLLLHYVEGDEMIILGGNE